MRFTTAILAAAALTGFTNAVQFTNSVFNNVTAGEPFTITWANATGPVTITLKNGPQLNLKDVTVIGSGLSGGSFTYQVPSTLPADTYAFEIKDSTPTPNYSPQFQLIGGAAATSTATPSATRSVSNSTQTTQSASASASASASGTGASNNTSATRTPTQSGTRSAASATGTPTQTRAPSSGMALTSNLALIFLFAGALMTLN